MPAQSRQQTNSPTSAQQSQEQSKARVALPSCDVSLLPPMPQPGAARTPKIGASSTDTSMAAEAAPSGNGFSQSAPSQMQGRLQGVGDGV